MTDELSPEVEKEIQYIVSWLGNSPLSSWMLTALRTQRLAGRADMAENLYPYEYRQAIEEIVSLRAQVETLKREMEAVMHRDALLVESLRIQIETLTRERDEARAELVAPQK